MALFDRLKIIRDNLRRLLQEYSLPTRQPAAAAAVGR